MKKKESVYNTSYSFDNYADEQDSYAFDQYGLRIKNRANKKRQTKFSDKKDREYNDY